MTEQQQQEPPKVAKEGYEYKLCKDGKWRQYKIRTDEEKQARLQKMREGKEKKKQERLQEQKQQQQEQKQQEPKLTRDDVKGILDEYIKRNKEEKEREKQQQQQQQQEEQEQKLKQQQQEQQQQEQEQQEPPKKRRHITKTIKSKHVLIPDQVEEISVDDDYQEEEEVQYYQW